MAYSKVTLNGETLMDVTSDTVEANKLLTGEIATAANGQKVTGTLVISNDFIITFSQNQNDEWEPDHTYAEIKAAYDAGKTIVTEVEDEYHDSTLATHGYFFDGGAHFMSYFYATILWRNENQYIITEYTLPPTGNDPMITDTELYNTFNADAVAADVRAGKTFFNGSGSHTGTATVRTSSDLTVSGATVTAPAGFYAAAATKSVASGSAGTPTATKGTVSNHSVSVTPSVTNTTGYITGGTKTGTAVSVSASELVSGTKSITENGNAIDVTNYANVNVNVPSNDFIINLELNQNGVFEPDCTFTEAVTAYNAGKTIIFSYDQNPVTGGYDADREWFTYSVYVYEIDGNGIGTMSTLNHRWTSSGITQTATASYYDLNNQNKTVIPVKSQQSITADTGYTGLGTVTMDPIPANYVQIKDTYLSNDFNITPSESTQYVEILDQVIDSNPQYPTLTISNKIGTCNVSFSGLENNVPYLMTFMVAGEHNNQYFHNYKSIIVMFTNEVTSINLSNFETDGYLGCVNSAIVTKSGNIIVNFNIDIVGSAYITLQYRKNNNNIIGCKYFHVAAIPSTYVGSGVTTRTSSNLTASGATVTAPAGYYANAATKSVTTASNPDITFDTSILRSQGKIKASYTQTEGYVTSTTKQIFYTLTTQASTTITPTTASQTAVAAGKYTLGDVTIGPIPSAYIIPSGTFSITSNSTYDITQYANVNVNVPIGKTDEQWIKIRNFPSQSFSYSLLSMRVGAFAETNIISGIFDEINIVPKTAFYHCISLSTIDLPKAQQIYEQAFTSCSILSNISAPKLTVIGSNAFEQCVNLVSLYFPSLISIMDRAFSKCSALETINAPELSYIGSYAFAYCSSLRTIPMTNIWYIGEYGFIGCTNLESMNLPSLRLLYSGAFSGCVNLSYFSAPILSSLPNNNIFYRCSALTTVYLPAVTSLVSSAFRSFGSLVNVNISSAGVINGYAFDGCLTLKSITAPNISRIGSYAFRSTAISTFIGQIVSSINTGTFADCSNLKKIILGINFNYLTTIISNCYNLISIYLLCSSMVALGGTVSNIFKSTPFYDYSNIAGRWGSIYVPASLYDTYKSGTNWNVISSRFVSLTSAQVEALLAEEWIYN